MEFRVLCYTEFNNLGRNYQHQICIDEVYQICSTYATNMRRNAVKVRQHDLTLPVRGLEKAPPQGPDITYI